jgi:hypothetical protein
MEEEAAAAAVVVEEDEVGSGHGKYAKDGCHDPGDLVTLGSLNIIRDCSN